jgi:hypothetical protein
LNSPLTPSNYVLPAKRACGEKGRYGKLFYGY